MLLRLTMTLNANAAAQGMLVVEAAPQAQAACRWCLKPLLTLQQLLPYALRG